MPRNGSGSYSLPEAAFIPNTAISSADVNSDLSDLATAMTGSLARDGQGGMTAVLPLANLGFTYFNDPNTGMRRTAADTQAISCGAVDVMAFSATGAAITGDLAVSGSITSGGAALIPIGLGPLPWSGLTAPAKWVFAGQTLLRASYPALWTFAQTEIAGGNSFFGPGNGSTTFTIASMAGKVPAGREAAPSVLVPPYFAGDSSVVGSDGGVQNRTLLAGNLPPYTPAGTLSNTVVQFGVSSNSANWGAGANNTLTAISPVGTGSTFTANVTQPGFTGTAQGGTSTAFGIVQPTIIVNYIIYAGA